MGDGTGDSGVGGHQWDLSQTLCPERALGEYSLDELDLHPAREEPVFLVPKKVSESSP